VSRHLRIKICGITNVEDAVLAAELGADAVGLNFHPGSPRSIDLAQAPGILQELPLFTQAVGVFVNRRLHEMAGALQSLPRIRTMQWHGDVDQREVGVVAPYALVAAFPVRDASSLDNISRYLEGCRSLGQMPAAILVDAHVPGQHGGTGRQAPWSLLAGFRPGVPLILAGGLTPENVADAVRTVRPYAVDVASGVEENPRKKDADKMRHFIANALEAQSKLSD
jgi:phosphoribosylanthranilate isomerase